MKCDQGFCLDEISHKSENGFMSGQELGHFVKSEKTLCTLWRQHFQLDNHETWSEFLS